MKKIPRVSVLMPAYNSEKYISEAIESILNQTFTDFEFIIINDGSTDNTAKIIKEYAKQDKRILFIDNKTNSGVSKIRNTLLDMAKGEYVAWMDSDDISLPNRLQIMSDYLDRNPDVSILGSALEKFPKYELMSWPECPGLLDFYIANSMPNPSSMMRRKDIINANLHYDENLPTAEDYDFFSHAVLKLKLHNIPNVLVKYRVDGASLSHNNSALYDCENIVRDRILQKLTHDKIWQLKISSFYRVRLFGIIPLLKFKRTRIYLFDCLPLLKLRGFWWRLFDLVPVLKVSK